MDKAEELKSKLKYGSLDKIKKAINQGAGILYRDDIEILLNEIQQLENDKRNDYEG